MRIAIYTAIFGKYKTFNLPETKISGWDFVSFLGEGGNIDAKKFKLLPHRYLPQYDVSVWIDGSIIIIDDIIPVIEKYLKEDDFVVLAHPGDHKHLSIYEEAEKCIQFGKGDAFKVKGQIDAYKREGCPEDREVIATGIIIRRHNKPNIIEFNEAWWNEIQKYSVKDQISFPYVAWKHQLEYKKIYTTHPQLKTLGILGASWFKKIYGEYWFKKKDGG